MSANRPIIPESVRESLAMIWVKEHAKDAKTPSDLFQMYQEAFCEIKEAHRQYKNQKDD